MNDQASYYKIHLLVYVCVCVWGGGGGGEGGGRILTHTCSFTLSLFGQLREDIARAGAGVGERSSLRSGEVKMKILQSSL